MSLTKGSLIVGGGSLQTYLKDGNNLHTEFVEEWILIEDSGLVKNTNYTLRLSDRNFDLRPVSLWATTTGNITLKIQLRGTDIFSFTVTAAQSANGYGIQNLIVPSKYDLVFTPAEAVTRFFLTAKQISICENLPLSR